MKLIKVPTMPVDNAPAAEEDQLIEDSLDGQVTARPDGYYWESPDGTRGCGPFESIELATADMLTADEESPEPGETLQEAEDELGIADWFDPDTGELAEGQSTPRLDGD